jgi:hypothetical protein
MPTTEGEYVINVRDVVDVVGDPGFAEEAGRPSIIALLRNLAVGDYTSMPDHGKIWQEDLTAIKKAAEKEDQQIMDPRIKASRGWVLEIMSEQTQLLRDRQR